MPYQPPLSTLRLLDAPTLQELYVLSDACHRFVLMHAGMVGEQAGGVNSLQPASSNGCLAFSFQLSNPNGEPIKCAVFDFPSNDKAPAKEGWGLVIEAGMSWDGENEDECLIEIVTNRAFSAESVILNSREHFYELLEAIAHEVAHVKDRAHTLTDPSYLTQKGKKADHTYLYDEGEVRARVWAAEATYAHQYQLLSCTGCDLPGEEHDVDVWDRLLQEWPTGDICLSDFNDSTRREVMERVRTTCLVLNSDRTSSNRKCPILSTPSTIAHTLRKGGNIDAETVAAMCVDYWRLRQIDPE